MADDNNDLTGEHNNKSLAETAGPPFVEAPLLTYWKVWVL